MSATRPTGWTGQGRWKAYPTTAEAPDPVRLAEEDRETPYEYYFHLATIDGNKVVQHQAGTVYLLIHPGTFGPSGMS